MTTPVPTPPNNLPIHEEPPIAAPRAEPGFDVPGTLDPTTTIAKQIPQSRHHARGVFVGIAVFISVVSLVAIAFIGYRLFSLSNVPEFIPAPSSTPSLTPVVTNQVHNTIPSATPVALQEELSDVDDPDQDGLTNAEERFYSTDIHKADTDDDGFNDSEEVRNGYNPLGTGKLDSDNDGFPDPDERKFGTDPFNPDTDRDGYADGAEITRGYNPLIASPNDKL